MNPFIYFQKKYSDEILITTSILLICLTKVFAHLFAINFPESIPVIIIILLYNLIFWGVFVFGLIKLGFYKWCNYQFNMILKLEKDLKYLILTFAVVVFFRLDYLPNFLSNYTYLATFFDGEFYSEKDCNIFNNENLEEIDQYILRMEKDKNIIADEIKKKYFVFEETANLLTGFRCNFSFFYILRSTLIAYFELLFRGLIYSFLIFYILKKLNLFKSH